MEKFAVSGSEVMGLGNFGQMMMEEVAKQRPSYGAPGGPHVVEAQAVCWPPGQEDRAERERPVMAVPWVCVLRMASSCFARVGR